jgi:hypothetical protein
MPRKIIPFWPIEDSYYNQEKCFIARVLMEENEIESNEISFSAPFWYNSKHRTLLKLTDNVKNTH